MCVCHDILVAGITGTSDNVLLYSDYMEKAMTNKKSAFLLFRSLNPMDFMIKKFSSPKMRNRQFVFAPKIEYKLVAESTERADKLREANQNSLTFPIWCPLFENARTFFERKS